jgi:3-methylcrotonyl-CoA carboxylase alpha subunit
MPGAGDCSVQRRNQKILEQSPAPGMSKNLRELMGRAAVEAAKAVNYVGAGTVEFIIDVKTNEYFFMEMNTRLQVEHPVTEMVSRQDLVQWPLHVAAGYPVPISQNDLYLYGHAIESRIYAESTEKGFLPSTGQIKYLSMPSENDRIRVDIGIRQGDEVSVYYDPMIAKLIVWGEDRNSALQNTEHALNNFHVLN